MQDRCCCLRQQAGQLEKMHFTSTMCFLAYFIDRHLPLPRLKEGEELFADALRPHYAH
ncbi:MAG: hypothetical protein ACLTGG_08840 [Subdoligranulum sp.]